MDLFGQDFNKQFEVLPNWDTLVAKKFGFIDDDEEENPQGISSCLDLGGQLYNKWQEIANSLIALEEDAKNAANTSVDFLKEYMHLIREELLPNIPTVGVNIYAGTISDAYILKMEHASLIRIEVKETYKALLNVGIFTPESTAYVEVIKEEIEGFKQLFKQWVGTFVKDDILDDWGLYA